MGLRKYLLAGGLSTVLILGACNGDGGSEEETAEDGTAGEETTEEETAETADEETTSDTEGDSAEGDISYSGEYGDYSVVEFGQYTIEPEEVEEETTEEETEEATEEEEPQPTEVVTIEFEYTNNSDVATSPQEAFGLDLAVRQMMEGGETTLENLTMDLPEDFEKSDAAAAASEMIEPGETATAVVAYGPVDPELETVLQNRENPMAEEESGPLDHTIELESPDSSEPTAEEEENAAEEEDTEEDSE